MFSVHLLVNALPQDTVTDRVSGFVICVVVTVWFQFTARNVEYHVESLLCGTTQTADAMHLYCLECQMRAAKLLVVCNSLTHPS